MPLPLLTRTTEEDARFILTPKLRAPVAPAPARMPSRAPEAGEQYRDMRLAKSLDFESLGVEQLGEISGDDMADAIDAVHARLNIGD